MAVQTIEEGMALFSLGLLDPDDIPALALRFVNEGRDVPDMAAIASSLPIEHPADRRSDFERAVRLAGYLLPSRVEAAQTLKRIYAERGASGFLGPRDAARLIMDVFDVVQNDLPNARAFVGDPFDIAKIIGLYYSYDDISHDDAQAALELDHELVDELRRLADAS
jgi:hypothetical protein